jgi:hypothetical protein
MTKPAVRFAVLALAAAPLLAAQKPPERIDPVAVVGCLREADGGNWILENASEPVPSHANAPTEKELAALPKPGKSTYRLLGVTVFNLGAHRGHLLAVKGLPIKDAKEHRLNVTSVTMVAETCPAGGNGR